MWLTVTDVLNLLAADRSAWRTVAEYPDSLHCRMIAWLADTAAADKERWEASRAAFTGSAPASAGLARLSALFGGSSPGERRIEVTPPLPADTWRPVEPLFALPIRRPAGPLSLTARRAIALADFAAAEPERYLALRLKTAGKRPELLLKISGLDLDAASKQWGETLKLAELES